MKASYDLHLSFDYGAYGSDHDRINLGSGSLVSSCVIPK